MVRALSLRVHSACVRAPQRQSCADHVTVKAATSDRWVLLSPRPHLSSPDLDFSNGYTDDYSQRTALVIFGRQWRNSCASAAGCAHIGNEVHRAVRPQRIGEARIYSLLLY